MRSHVIVFAWLQMVLASILTLVVIGYGLLFLFVMGPMMAPVSNMTEAPEPPPSSQSTQQAKPKATQKPPAGHSAHQTRPTPSHPAPQAKPTAPAAAPEPDGATVEYNYRSGFYPATGVLIVFCIALCALSIAAGVGLLRLAPWARKLGIAVAILDILTITPLTLALGVYGLIILLNSETAGLFQSSPSLRPAT